MSKQNWTKHKQKENSASCKCRISKAIAEYVKKELVVLMRIVMVEKDSAGTATESKSLEKIIERIKPGSITGRPGGNKNSSLIIILWWSS